MKHIFSFILIFCAQTSLICAAVDDASPSIQTPSNPQNSKDAEIKIKGLYIGMDIRSIGTWFKEKLGQSDAQIIVTKNNGDPAIVIDRSVGIVLLAGPLSLLEKSDTPVDLLNFLWKLLSQEGEGGEYTRANVHPSIILANNMGCVNEISLSGNLVNYLFKATDMEPTEFVKQFVEAYNIPEMKVSDDRKSWCYTSSGGIKITIDQTKRVTLIKGVSKAEVKGAFD